MKFKKMVVPKFIHKDGFGDFEFSNVEILVDSSNKSFKPEEFNQSVHEYYLDDEVIISLANDSARRFLSSHSSDILRDKYLIPGDQVNLIKDVMQVNKSELADLLGIDKASVSRIIKNEQALKKDVSMLLLERLKDEVESPGISRRLLEKIRQKDAAKSKIVAKDLDVFQVAEYLIRFFEERMDNLTHLKLQKLLYYAQGIGFGRFNCRLMSCNFTAWEHGPVIEEVYKKYKNHASNPLSRDDNVKMAEIVKDEVVLSILKETISFYGIYSAWALRNKTHSEAPWLETEQSKTIEEGKIIKFFQDSLI
jgi:uncharacterized phage-associated protein